MFIQNLSKREKTILSICVILGVTAIAYSLIIEPFIMRWRTLNDQIESKIALLIKNTRLLKMHKALEAEYAKYHGFMEISEDEEKELAKALGEIENVSAKSSCNIANIKPRASRKLGNYKEIFFEVTAEGSISELAQFLYEIETSREYLRIRHFTIMSKAGPPDKLKGTFLISKIILGS